MTAKGDQQCNPAKYEAHINNRLFKNAFLDSKKTKHLSVKKITRLMLFGEVITVYSDNHATHVNTL
jgi:hypothetical protein